MVKSGDERLNYNLDIAKKLRQLTKDILDKVKSQEKTKKVEIKIDDDKIPMFSKKTRDKILNRENQEMEIK